VADISLPSDDALRRSLIQVVKILQAQNQEIGKLNASIMAHRRAIAAGHSDPTAFETQLRQFEIDTQGLALSSQGFPEAEAIVALLEAGKDPDTFDA
jgi:hypothetical protein